jgi:hypothetical protein
LYRQLVEFRSTEARNKLIGGNYNKNQWPRG